MVQTALRACVSGWLTGISRAVSCIVAREVRAGPLRCLGTDYSAAKPIIMGAPRRARGLSAGRPVACFPGRDATRTLRFPAPTVKMVRGPIRGGLAAISVPAAPGPLGSGPDARLIGGRVVIQARIEGFLTRQG